jgi:hypothetical protein
MPITVNAIAPAAFGFVGSVGHRGLHLARLFVECSLRARRARKLTRRIQEVCLARRFEESDAPPLHWAGGGTKNLRVHEYIIVPSSRNKK